MSKWSFEDSDLIVEKQIVTGMIVSESFLRKIRKVFNTEFLQSDFCKIVSKWCVDHFDEYGTNPGKFIQDIFLVKSSKLESDITELISLFLTNLSKEYSSDEEARNQYESAYLLNKAENYLQLRALTIKLEKANSLLNQQKIDHVFAELGNLNKIKLNLTKSVDPLRDDELFLSALSKREEYLFKLDGAFGDFVGPLMRKQFFAIAGPAKRGKSYLMNEIAIQAVMRGLSVAYFSMGDMFAEEISLRTMQRITARPLKPGLYIFPVKDCLNNQNGSCSRPERLSMVPLIRNKGQKPKFGEHDPNYIPCTACDQAKYTYWFTERRLHALDYAKGLKVRDKFLRQYKGKYKAEFWSRGQASVNDVIAKLETWELFDNFIPSIVITDYADIMASDSYHKEDRNRLNEIWMAHDALAKDRDILVITGTHTNRATFDRDIEQSDISDDIRKMNHVNGCIALNQTSEERKNGIMRIKYLFARDDSYSNYEACVLLQQLSVGQFYLDSYTV